MPSTLACAACSKRPSTTAHRGMKTLKEEQSSGLVEEQSRSNIIGWGEGALRRGVPEKKKTRNKLLYMFGFLGKEEKLENEPKKESNKKHSYVPQSLQNSTPTNYVISTHSPAQ